MAHGGPMAMIDQPFSDRLDALTRTQLGSCVIHATQPPLRAPLPHGLPAARGASEPLLQMVERGYSHCSAPFTLRLGTIRSSR